MNSARISLKSATTTTMYASKASDRKILISINELRLETISRRAIREGYKRDAIATKLMRDSYWRELLQKEGEKKAFKTVTKIIEKAIAKEIDSRVV